MARFRFLLLSLVVLAGAGAGYYLWQGREAAGPADLSTAQTTPGGRRAAPGGGIPVPVTVAAAERRDLRLTLDALGTVQALNNITVRSQVSGTLTEVLFREGQEVKAGEILARIDDRTYAAALAQAVGRKNYDLAQLENARADLRRYQGLLAASGVTRQQVDTQRAQVAMFEAQVAQDQAAIDTAQTQLDYTTIRAPIDGRVGLRQVDAGNLVSSGDATGIVTITQMRPIAVSFTIPQGELPRLMRAMAAGPVPVETVPSSGGTPSQPLAQNEAPERGTVLTVDNQVDQATGTVRVKAVFPNDATRLWPGAFVSLRIGIETVPDATVVPLVAVQQGPNGAFAFVARPDNTVEQRPLTLGAVTEGEAAVREGLQPGEQVVTSGALRLNPGSAIALSNGGNTAPAAPPPRPPRARQAADAAP
ncbi:efflux RND transporter periplasmic adaptor subunit [Teichococcus vastitatis]|jgi:multidrug efflux system membrane fusion protein|uniref:Efflux RND transporter periplasmic adaptor subunit n=1 Tax=Teichococcus vastitatis TaxID=2307076 RepID=A0ABS9W4Z4_9PROT|nr:efflux RND transporter periplasmic adaptor subunit [Pseudoroseomonas vastitatis]MCI0753684.1 efflux RND transporter periplasmic adaptor subunit [Pseudoroseomonas vastitatis]